MKTPKQLIILTVLLSIHTISSQAQPIIFPPVGSYWIYANEGADQNVKTIRMERVEDTLVTILTHEKYVPKLSLRYLDQSGDIVFTGHYLMSVRSPASYIGILDSFPEYGWRNIAIPFSPVFVWSGGTIQVHLLNSFDPSYDDYYKKGINHLIVYDTMTYITINNVKLRVYHISDLLTTGNMPQECMQVCSPIIERIGSLGYFAPLNLCTQDTQTIYAGRLLTYYDPEVGVFDIPDSLREGNCSFAKPLTGIEDENEISKGLNVYPNPAYDRLYIELNGESNSARYEIYNITDQRLMAGEVIGDRVHTVNIEGLSTGIYFYKLLPDNLGTTYSGTFIRE